MNLGKLKFVLFFIVKDRAVFVDEAHHGRLPARRAQKANNHVEEPVLISQKVSKRGRYLPLLVAAQSKRSQVSLMPLNQNYSNQNI